MSSSAYPGTPEHQRLLRAIAQHYAHDDRVLAVIVFGSLGRGTWDEHSDLDLDVVIADGVTLDVQAEARRLCIAIGEEPVVVVPGHADAADVVLASLMELSIRYHPLASTNPNIVETMVVLAGPLAPSVIAEAGRQNQKPPPPGFPDLVGACIRQAVTADAKLHRENLWLGYLLLHEARDRLLQIVAASHGVRRPYHAIEGILSPELLARLRLTLPHDDLPSMRRAFVALLDLLEHDLEVLSAGRARLTEAQRQIVARLRARQVALDPSVAEPDDMPW